MVEVFSAIPVDIIILFQNLRTPMMKQEAPTKCVLFALLNDLIKEASKPGFYLSGVIGKQEIQQVQGSYIRWQVLMRSFSKPDNPMCKICRIYMMQNERAQKLRTFLQDKKHIKYRDIPQLRQWDKDKGRLFDQIVAITQSIHRRKICRLQQSSILQIPDKDRSQIIRRCLEPSLAKRELYNALEEIQIELEEDSFEYQTIYDR